MRRGVRDDGRQRMVAGHDAGEVDRVRRDRVRDAEVAGDRGDERDAVDDVSRSSVERRRRAIRRSRRGGGGRRWDVRDADGERGED